MDDNETYKYTIEFEDGSKLERIVEFENSVSPRFVDVKCLKWFKKQFKVKDWYWERVDNAD